MSKILNQMEKPTNLKPSSWYRDYLRFESSLNTIEELKQLDIMANDNQSYSISGFLQFEDKNNLDANKQLLEYYRKELKILPLFQEIENPLNIQRVVNNSIYNRHYIK